MSVSDYQAVIGLEVHAELRTKTKIFCSCPTAFGAAPNTQCCPVCMGLPGAMPVLNRGVVELAVKAGLALGCRISPMNHADRKQYFYPDLPKAYQISQDEVPLCHDGFLDIRTDGEIRSVRISRIHIEEDAGKLIHRDGETGIDCNRCGIPLIEIVTAPDLQSGREAAAFLRTLRAILVTCGVSDCRMQEGSMRCDVNLSLRRKDTDAPGIRTEIKNINSFAFVEKAVTYETSRQAAILDGGGEVARETLRFDADTGKTCPMRGKESAADYRFFREPDIPAFRLTAMEINAWREELPELPDKRRERMTVQYGISASDAEILTADPLLADYFERAARLTGYPKILAGLLLTGLLGSCRSDPFNSPVSAARLAELAELAGTATVNSGTAKKLLIRLLSADFSPREVAYEEQLTQINDGNLLLNTAKRVIEENAGAVADYRAGKKNALRALQGKAMALFGGRANPVLLEKILIELLNAGKRGETNV